MNKIELVEYEITDKSDNILAIVENTTEKTYKIIYTDLGNNLNSYNNIQVQSAIYHANLVVFLFFS